MKLKLTLGEFTALYNLFGQLINSMKPADMLDMLLMAGIVSAYQKMYNKAFAVKQQYSIKLSTEEALAFWNFFHEHPLPAALVFEINLVQTISNDILQKYTTT